MKLSHETVESFRDLYQSKSGVTLSNDEAKELASDLLNFVDLLYRKVAKADSQKLEKYRL